MLVFKQHCFDPNRPKTAVINREHIRYIATRTGVVCNEGMTHGLYGKAFGMETSGDISDLDSIRRKYKRGFREKNRCHCSVISLTEKKGTLSKKAMTGGKPGSS